MNKYSKAMVAAVTALLLTGASRGTVHFFGRQPVAVVRG